MGSMFRSELMSLCQLFIQSEAAYNCVSELGNLGMVEFKDLNPDVNAFQRRFVNEVRRCDEMERKLRFLEKEIKKEFIPILDTGDNPDVPQPREMIDLEATFEKLEMELKDVNKNAEALKKTYSELTELKQILMKAQHFFNEVDLIQKSETEMSDDMSIGFANLLADDGIHGYSGSKLGFVAGVIRRERLVSFERILWRVCRGNAFLRQTDIEDPLEDPVTGDHIYKTVFIIFFQSKQLKSKIKKICEGFQATLYPCPEEVSDRRELIVNVVSRIEDLNTVLCQTTKHRHRILLEWANKIKNWFIKVRKMKAIYSTMNLFNFDVTQKWLIAECWCPNSDLDIVRTALRRATEKSGSSMPSLLNRMNTCETPPTFNRTNKFTIGFQNIVDAYGVSNYREVNPAPFTIITFPFLFAVMFGDAGHGFIMMLFALWMVLKERSLAAQKSNNEIWLTFFNGRYIILLMGCFSIYTGMIYNDIFSKSINLFGSSWIPLTPGPNKDGKIQFTNKIDNLDPILNQTSAIYPFGMDPIWQISQNKNLFLNSIKMKVSVILGVSQMLFGVALSCWNHVYFRKYSNIVFEFIPQIIFLMAIFGYMNGMIFAKWFKYSAISGPNGSFCAPNILNTLINMFLFKYPNDPNQPCYLNTWYWGQKYFQTILLLLALICVPWMLVLKPWYLSRQNKRETERTTIQTRDTAILISSEMENSEQTGQGGYGEDGGRVEEFDLGDVITHQAIHTIEYCLGSISHTASYLRLWALSLAHAQLSEIVWTVFTIGINDMGFGNVFNAIIMCYVFAFWSCLTISGLLLIEGLSAFLHALRLHWVEFQSKFYGGSGFAFQPFAFEAILELADKESAAEMSS